MRKLVLMGRSEAGKTTLTQALKGEEIRYYKTQYVQYYESFIDTPGEYAQSHRLGQDKYEGLSREYQMKDVLPPEPEQMQMLKKVVESVSRLECQIGG